MTKIRGNKKAGVININEWVLTYSESTQQNYSELFKNCVNSYVKLAVTSKMSVIFR